MSKSGLEEAYEVAVVGILFLIATSDLVFPIMSFLLKAFFYLGGGLLILLGITITVKTIFKKKRKDGV